MTRLQHHKRERFRERHANVSELRRQANDARVAASEAARQLKDREKYTVRLGIEQGFRDPTHVLNVCVHPREFEFGIRTQSADRFANVNYYASMIGREVAEKVTRLLVDFVGGVITPR
jgi:hypothetical protein